MFKFKFIKLYLSFVLTIVIIAPEMFMGWGKIIDGKYIISSSFCEPRPQRYHLGIDLRTPQGKGMSVYAPSDGYVIRAKVSPYGYGKVLYYKLESGEILVFAHLSRFAPKIENAIKLRQNKLKKYTVEIWMRKDEIPFKEGEIIAYTGETGAGTPHLHFEYHQELGHLLNPLSKVEITDKHSPIIKRILFIPIRDKSSIKGSNFPYSMLAKNIGRNIYSLNHPITYNGEIVLGVDCVDYTSSAWLNTLGIYKMNLFIDDTLIYTKAFDEIIDSVFYLADDTWSDWKGMSFYKLFSPDFKKGIVKSDNEKKDIRVEIFDYSGNKASIKIELLSSKNNNHKIDTISTNFEKVDTLKNGNEPNFKILYLGNSHYLNFKFEKKLDENPEILVKYYDGRKFSCIEETLVTEKDNDQSFIKRIDIPLDVERFEIYLAYKDSTRQIVKKYDVFTFIADITTSKIYSYYSDFFEMNIRKNTLAYTTQIFVFKKQNGEKPNYCIYPENIPLKRKILIGLKIPDTTKQSGSMVVSVNGGPYYIGSSIDNGYVWGGVNSGGIYSYNRDTKPPQIISPFKDGITFKNLHRLYFKISDEGSGFGNELSPDLFINGEWYPAEFDPERNLLEYYFEKPLGQGEYIIKVVADDRSGNRTELKRKIYINGSKQNIQNGNKKGK